MLPNLSTLAGSRADSASSRITRGKWLVFKIANNTDNATRVFSPPERANNELIFLPGGEARISIPDSRIFSSLVNSIKQVPPPNKYLNISGSSLFILSTIVVKSTIAFESDSWITCSMLFLASSASVNSLNKESYLSCFSFNSFIASIFIGPK